MLAMTGDMARGAMVGLPEIDRHRQGGVGVGRNGETVEVVAVEDLE